MTTYYGNVGTIGIGTVSGNISPSFGASTYYTTSSSYSYSSATILVKGAGSEETEISATDIKINGKSLIGLLERLEDRFLILNEPTPEKLEKYAALKEAYDQYKLLEKLIADPDLPN
jgi:hypothetical protein